MTIDLGHSDYAYRILDVGVPGGVPFAQQYAAHRHGGLFADATSGRRPGPPYMTESALRPQRVWKCPLPGLKRVAMSISTSVAAAIISQLRRRSLAYWRSRPASSGEVAAIR